MLVTTTHEIQGQPIQQYLGIVVGETILATNIFRDIGAGLRDIIGGRSGAYEKKMTEARETAISEMIEKAGALGADADRRRRHRLRDRGQRDDDGLGVGYGRAGRIG